jgi:phosphoglycerate dehydrogenase-like enzyme
VEHNGVIVSRTNWSQTVVSAGDRLEVVHFVGGGCDADDLVAMSDSSKDSHRSP